MKKLKERKAWNKTRGENRHRGKPGNRTDYLSENTLQERSDSNSCGREERTLLCAEKVSHICSGEEEEAARKWRQSDSKRAVGLAWILSRSQMRDVKSFSS